MGPRRIKAVVNPLIVHIERMLQRTHCPLVTPKPSQIIGAGRGVFTNQRVSKGAILCFYPGVYSVGLPPGTEVGPFLHDPVTFIGHLFPPSGSRMRDDNSYILNFEDPPSGIVDHVSGYIDGLALEVAVKSSDEMAGSPLTRRLDENPSACAHLVNHSHDANVRVVSFAWDDVVSNITAGTEHCFHLPNTARNDGAPRYMHHYCAETIYYDEGEPSVGTKDVCGAVLCADVDIEADVEILRDYKLEQPLPDWAADWFVFPPVESDDEDDSDDDKWRLIP